MIDTTQILGTVQARLTASSSLTAIIPAASIGAYVKEDTAYPVLTYQIGLNSLQVKGEDGQQVDLQFDIYTNYRGPKQALQVADIIRGLFDQVPVTIASGDSFGCFYDNMDHFQEPEGTVYRASIAFNLLVSDS